MRLRKLECKDAPLMLEWMHDESVVSYMHSDFMSKTLADCLLFIKSAQDDTKNMHYAIVNELDIYLGTVSLKNISNDSAEFAITIRKCAMGKGISSVAMNEIIKLGFNKGLKRIYWCVASENIRAIKFYEKNGYQRCKKPVVIKSYSPEEMSSFIWYETSNQ